MMAVTGLAPRLLPRGAASRNRLAPVWEALHGVEFQRTAE